MGLLVGVAGHNGLGRVDPVRQRGRIARWGLAVTECLDDLAVVCSHEVHAADVVGIARAECEPPPDGCPQAARSDRASRMPD